MTAALTNLSLSTKNIRFFLKKIIQDQKIHSRWLNTISFLEHIGSRKILATQSGFAVGEMILRHASEETRHAHFFKRMSERISPGTCPDYQMGNLHCGFSAFLYFQRLDGMVLKNLNSSGFKGKKRSFLSYLYVTHLVEERADFLYQEYDQILEENGIPVSLKAILKEEESHLSEMKDALYQEDSEYKTRYALFQEKEEKNYLKFEQTLLKSVGID
ncbi:MULTISPECIES: hypothetical protein [Leptospira]|uniref:Rubrerythrin n=1 Tax=Leptospira kirschneri serovar Pomona TaxID=561005 RepID=A0A1T1DKM9_9LEPT|nr:MULTISPECIES: hypothetical protein [Leptospira]EMO76140.1 hypothetical protein LEP1GSC127_3527 [Leptospira kirschneri str. 200801925]EKP07198.1 hypothetical protein LEP1GSC018_2887 [Leptospira kirschneri str. 2008720114]EMJ92747.1 hypothetical protein LEP1GSC198_3864 [Leptospira kirschneri str. JB]EMK02880.1 hypothetical protein LEP1GSC166_1995 [Leptospira kirschneri]EMK15955.1 hypothetical protein LEP1GSC042_2179 [Leptospira kirschneri serovar Bim str. PUO 1247]